MKSYWCFTFYKNTEEQSSCDCTFSKSKQLCNLGQRSLSSVLFCLARSHCVLLNLKRVELEQWKHCISSFQNFFRKMGASDLIDSPQNGIPIQGFKMIQVLPTDGAELVSSELHQSTPTSPGTDRRLFWCRQEPDYSPTETKWFNVKTKLNYLRTKTYFPHERILSPFPQIITGEYYICICIK